jgi:hypothetical protein
MLITFLDASENSAQKAKKAQTYYKYRNLSFARFSKEAYKVELRGIILDANTI